MKKLTFEEYEILGSVLKVVKVAFLSASIEIGNKDGRTKNRKLLRILDKAQEASFDAKIS